MSENDNKSTDSNSNKRSIRPRPAESVFCNPKSPFAPNQLVAVNTYQYIKESVSQFIQITRLLVYLLVNYDNETVMNPKSCWKNWDKLQKKYSQLFGEALRITEALNKYEKYNSRMSELEKRTILPAMDSITLKLNECKTFFDGTNYDRLTPDWDIDEFGDSIPCGEIYDCYDIDECLEGVHEVGFSARKQIKNLQKELMSIGFWEGYTPKTPANKPSRKRSKPRQQSDHVSPEAVTWCKNMLVKIVNSSRSSMRLTEIYNKLVKCNSKNIDRYVLPVEGTISKYLRQLSGPEENKIMKSDKKYCSVPTQLKKNETEVK